MKLSIASSGGFGNIRLHGELDTSELESTLAEKTESVLRPERLNSIHLDTGKPAADATQFELCLFLEDGLRRYTLDEASGPPDVVEVLHALLHEIVLKKRRTS